MKPAARSRRSLRSSSGRIQAGQLTRSKQHGVGHLLGQLAGEGVLLAGMEGAEQDGPPVGRAELGAVAEAGPRPGPGAGGGPSRRSTRTRRGTGSPAGVQQRQLSWSVGQAVLALPGSGLVRRRRAPDGGADPGVDQPQPVAGCVGGRLVGEPARCMAAKSQSPDRSPVNTRPVRLAPCAAGARPRRTPRRRDRRSRARAGPSTPGRGTPPASRSPPARATPPAAGSGGSATIRSSSSARLILRPARGGETTRSRRPPRRPPGPPPRRCRPGPAPRPPSRSCRPAPSRRRSARRSTMADAGGGEQREAQPWHARTGPAETDTRLRAPGTSRPSRTSQSP